MILSKIAPYTKAIKIAVVGVLIILLGIFYYLYQEANEDLQVAKAEVATLEEDIQGFKNKLEDEEKNLKTLRSNKADLESRYATVYRELQLMRQNKEDAVANPSEVEQKIEDSFNGYMSSVACLTGDYSQCSD